MKLQGSLHEITNKLTHLDAVIQGLRRGILHDRGEQDIVAQPWSEPCESELLWRVNILYVCVQCLLLPLQTIWRLQFQSELVAV